MAQQVDGFADFFSTVASGLKEHAGDMIKAAAEIKKAKMLQKGDLDLAKMQAKANAAMYGSTALPPDSYYSPGGTQYGRNASDLFGSNGGLILGVLGVAGLAYLIMSKK